MDKHYICTGGCNGSSEGTGTCEAEYCKKEGEMLTECDCQDGLHSDHVGKDGHDKNTK